MTVQVKIIGMGRPPNKAAHVEVFTHTDRQQIVIPEQCFLLQEGDEHIITLYEGFGVRINEVEVEEDAAQDEIPELLYEAPADDTPEK